MNSYQLDAEAFARELMGTAWKGKRRQVGEKITGTCPKSDHPDKHPSFSYNSKMDAWACSCGSGKGSELRKILGFTSRSSRLPPLRPRPSTPTNHNGHRSDSDIDRLYDYTDADGKPLFQVVRYRNPKGFAQRQLNGSGWTWNTKGVKRTLYRLPAVLTAIKAGATICISEGEKDAENLVALGLEATTSPGGAQSWSPDYGEFLRGARIVIFPHNDPEGDKYREAVFNSVNGKAQSIKVVSLPELPEHGDVSDWLAAGGTKEALLKIVSETPTIGIDNDIPDPVLVCAYELMRKPVQPVEWILNPFVSVGDLTVIQGSPKGGKSCFALLLSLLASSGRSLDWIGVKDPARTLYVSFEDEVEPLLHTRLVEYSAGLGVEPGDYLVFADMLSPSADPDRWPLMYIDTEPGRIRIENMIRNEGIKFLVIDTLSCIHTRDENKAQEMNPLLLFLRGLARRQRCGILVIHHTRKGGTAGDAGNTSERGRGSSAISAGWGSIINWGRRASNTTSCELVSKRTDGCDFSVHYERIQTDTGSSVVWSLESASESAGRKELMIRVTSALESLSTMHPEGVVRSQVAGLLSISTNTAQIYLDMLVDENEASRVRGKNRAWFYSKSAAKELTTTADHCRPGENDPKSASRQLPP